MVLRLAHGQARKEVPSQPAIVAAMVDLVQVQHCVSAEPWFEVYIPSQTTEGVEYRIMVPYPEDPAEELICECPGFNYRGYCVHQELAYAMLCRWHELDGPEQQTPEQAHDHVCPRCGDETIKESEYVD